MGYPDKCGAPLQDETGKRETGLAFRNAPGNPFSACALFISTFLAIQMLDNANSVLLDSSMNKLFDYSIPFLKFSEKYNLVFACTFSLARRDWTLHH